MVTDDGVETDSETGPGMGEPAPPQTREARSTARVRDTAPSRFGARRCRSLQSVSPHGAGPRHPRREKSW